MSGGDWVVLRKEVRETLRDWRTLLMMVGVPVLLYPMLLVVSQQLAFSGMRRVEAAPAQIAVAGAVSDELLASLAREERLQVRPLGGDPEAVDALVRAGAAAVRRGDVDAVAVVAPAFEALGTAAVTLLYDETRERSQRAQGLLRGALREWGDSLFAARVREHGLPAGFGQPVVLADSSLARPEERGGYLLGRFLPAILILITLLGAFYPAIDLAAGEKERGTLETLLTSPVPPLRIVMGKFATVALVALVAAVLNLGSMLLTFQTGLFQLSMSDAAFNFALPPLAIFWVAVILVPMAAFFAAVFLGIAVRSHSFKEAQNALTPVLMLAILPALLPILPGTELTSGMAVVPVAGPGLLFRDLMAGNASPDGAFLVLLATVFYAGVALLFAADAFGREQVLFGTGESGVSTAGGGLFGRLRRWRGQDPTPAPGQALLLLAAIAALNFFLGPRFAARFGIEGGLVAAQWLLMLLPVLIFVVVAGFSARETLSLRRPSGRQIGGAVLIIAGGMPLTWFIAWLQSFVIPVPDELVEMLRQLVTAETMGRLLWILFVAAITPAVCEEFLFRGALLGSSRSAMTPARALALNAFVFAIFHLSIARFLPTAWLGLLLAWVVWRTRSIWTGVVMHAINNGFIVVLVSLPATREWGVEGAAAPPWILLPLGVLLLMAGVRVLRSEE